MPGHGTLHARPVRWIAHRVQDFQLLQRRRLPADHRQVLPGWPLVIVLGREQRPRVPAALDGGVTLDVEKSCFFADDVQRDVCGRIEKRQLLANFLHAERCAPAITGILYVT